MDIKIRHGLKTDAPFIAEFQQKMAWETEHKQLDPTVVRPAVEAVFEDERRGFYLVAEVESQVVGSLLVTYEWSDWRNCEMWYIQSVYVAHEFRGHGVFRNLYSRVIELAKAANAMFVRLYVEIDNKKAQETYEKLGMKRMPYYMYDVRV